jgi:hypothetical protein
MDEKHALNTSFFRWRWDLTPTRLDPHTRFLGIDHARFNDARFLCDGRGRPTCATWAHLRADLIRWFDRASGPALADLRERTAPVRTSLYPKATPDYYLSWNNSGLSLQQRQLVRRL